MPWDVGTQQYFICCYCTGKATCECDLGRTTGGCWSGNHDECKGMCNSSNYGHVPCACRCHLPLVTEAEVQAAIASIKEVRR